MTTKTDSQAIVNAVIALQGNLATAQTNMITTQNVVERAAASNAPVPNATSLGYAAQRTLMQSLVTDLEAIRLLQVNLTAAL